MTIIKIKNYIKIIIKNKIASYIFTIAFIILILYLTHNHWNEYKNISKINISSICWISMLFIISEIANGYKVKLLSSVFNIKLNFTEWFGLEFIRAFVNYLPLSAGLIYSAAYLKQKKKLPVSKYISLAAIITVLPFLVYGLIGTIILLIWLLILNKLNITLLVFSIIFIFIGLGILIIPFPKIGKENRFLNWMKSAKDGWVLIKKRKSILLKIIILDIFMLVFISLRFYIIFQNLGYSFDFSEVVLLTTMTSLIRFTSIFPGNLGLRESVAGGVTKSFNFSFESGFLVGIIDRIIEMFWVFLFGIIFSFVLIKHKTKY